MERKSSQGRGPKNGLGKHTLQACHRRQGQPNHGLREKGDHRSNHKHKATFLSASKHHKKHKTPPKRCRTTSNTMQRRHTKKKQAWAGTRGFHEKVRLPSGNPRPNFLQHSVLTLQFATLSPQGTSARSTELESCLLSGGGL